MTNIAAMTALRTLQSTTTALERTQQNISTGLRVFDAKDDAAYWSISTTMRSDVQSMSAIQDGLGIAGALVDTAYVGLTEALDVVSRIKSLIVAAKSEGVDRSKIQSEIDASKVSLVDIARSASFAGVNWLNTSIPDIQSASDDRRLSQIMSSIQRGSDGKLGLATMSVNVAQISLFNVDGGGLLQADSRSPKTIGGLRFIDNPDLDGISATGYETHGPGAGGSRGVQSFEFDGPITFGASDAMTFTVRFGAEDSTDLPSPWNLGDSRPMTVDRSVVDDVLPGAGGVVATNAEWAAVLRKAAENSGADQNVQISAYNVHYPLTDTYTHHVRFSDRQQYAPSDGTSMQITGFSTTTTSSGGVGETTMNYGGTASELDLLFEPFHVAQDVEIHFRATIYGQTYSYSIDRDAVDAAIGSDSGVVQNADEMVALLSSIIVGVPNLTIEASGSSGVRLVIDRAGDRSSGINSGLSISDVSVNIEPLPAYDIMDVDVEDEDMIDTYLQVVDAMESRVTTAAAKMGAMQNAIDRQTGYLDRLADTFTEGIGILVDADMTEESTRLKALQTQEQLGIQALSIANTTSRSVLSLFQ